MLENRRKKYKEMDASKKKQMLNRKAVKSRKRERSKLNVDVCIMESQIPLGPGKFHVVVLVLSKEWTSHTKCIFYSASMSQLAKALHSSSLIIRPGLKAFTCKNNLLVIFLKV